MQMRLLDQQQYTIGHPQSAVCFPLLDITGAVHLSDIGLFSITCGKTPCYSPKYQLLITLSKLYMPLH
jgi:hypothetical protein